MIDDSSSKWVGGNNRALVEYLCRKVAIEESIDTLDNTNLHSSCGCNINLNKCLKASSKGNLQEAIEFLSKSVIIANDKFSILSNKSAIEVLDLDLLDQYTSQYYDNDLFLNNLLPLYDIFSFFGRIINDGSIRNIIKQAIYEEYNLSIKNTNIRFNFLKISNFLIKFLDNPSKFLKMFRS